MKILNSDVVSMIESLAKSEASLINMAFTLSNERGLLHLSNAITSFEEGYVKPQYGCVVNSFCSEYRIFIIKLLLNIDNEYKDEVLSEVLIPTVNKFNNLELLTLLKEDVLFEYEIREVNMQRAARGADFIRVEVFEEDVSIGLYWHNAKLMAQNISKYGRSIYKNINEFEELDRHVSKRTGG